MSDRSMSEPEGPRRSHVNAALLVSVQSAVWTVASSSVAVWLGIHSHTAVLVAFGAIGFVDAVGSIALVYYFRHGLRHDRLSERLEELAHHSLVLGPRSAATPLQAIELVEVEDLEHFLERDVDDRAGADERRSRHGMVRRHRAPGTCGH